GRGGGDGGDGGNSALRQPTDAGERPAGVDGVAAHGEGIDVRVGVRVPGGSGAGGSIERCHVVARRALVPRVPARVDGRPAHRQDGDKEARVRVPGGGGTNGVEGGNAVARLPADAGEDPARVNRGGIHR